MVLFRANSTSFLYPLSHKISPYISLLSFDGNIAFKPELKRLNDLGWTKLSPSGKVENKEEEEYLRPFAKLTDKG